MTSLLGLAILLYAAAAAGMVYVAGFGPVGDRLSRAHWWWLAPGFAAMVVAYAGYYFAYGGVRRADGGPELDRRTMLAVVTAGFGGFLAQGAGRLYERAMRSAGARPREAKVRSTALAGLEQGALALIVCPSAALALILGVAFPRPSFSWPWAVIPLPGLVLAAWLAARHRGQLRQRQGWRGHLGLFLDAIHLVVFELLLRPGKCWRAIAGMLLYWAGDMFGLWATTAAFGYHMTALAVIVAMGSGMFVPRRTAPLGGAGILMLALVPTVWYSAGVPLAVATLGVLLYRAFTLWVPLIPGLIWLPELRALDDRRSRSTRAQPILQT